MKILFIDTNLNQIKHLSSILLETTDRVQIVGIATDLQGAVSKTSEHKPDLVLLSRELRKTDGFAVSKEIMKINTEMSIIMYGDEETTEILRRAMELEFLDYIGRPILKKKIVAAIAKYHRKVESRRYHLLLDMEKLGSQATELIEFSFIYSVLFYGDLKWEWKNYQHLLNISGSGYVIFFSLQKTNNHEEVSYDLLSKLLKKNVTPGYRCIVGREMTREIIIFVMAEKGQELNRDTSRVEKIRFGEYIRKILREMFGVETKVGIGSERSIEKLPTSYEEALRSVRFDRTGVTTYGRELSDEEKEKQQFRLEIEQKFLGNIREGSKEAIKNLGTLLELIADYSCKDKKNKIIELFVLASNVSRRDEFNEKEHADFLELGCELYVLPEEEIDSWALRSMSYVLKSVRDKQMQGSNSDMRKVMRYMDAHYDEEITLEEVAGVLNISPQYFSRIFREKTKMTYVDYLTKVRIKKAKEWLSYSDMNVQEVCFKVGYRDPNYFSRVFKKNVGVTPKQFMERAK